MYPSLSGCSPLHCPASVALPVATLPPALLSGSSHYASHLTRQKSKDIRKERKLNICSALIKSILLYDAENMKTHRK